VADLAIIMTETEWQNPIMFMVHQFSKPETMPVLLKFLSVLPEELQYNTKIQLDREEFESRKLLLLKNNATTVLEILFNALETDNRLDIMECISSWIRSGSISVDLILKSQLVQLSFENLQQMGTFDVGVDMVCDIIHESSKTPRNEGLVQMIYPFLNNLLPFLRDNIEDDEITRGLCRILVEAGEGLIQLI
jgi:transportin-3